MNILVGYFEEIEKYYKSIKEEPFSYEQGNCYVYWSRILQRYTFGFDWDIDRTMCGMKYISHEDAIAFCNHFNNKGGHNG